MSLKRREILAAVLLLAAAILWTWGQQSIRLGQIHGLTPTGAESTVRGDVTQAAGHGVTETEPGVPGSATEATGGVDAEAAARAARERTLGLILSFAAGIPGGAAVFALRKRRPILGVDGSAAVLSALTWALLRGELLWEQGPGRMLLRLALAYGVLVFLRELWGWLRERCCLRWCLCYRLAAGCRRSAPALLVFAGWLLLTALVTGLALTDWYYRACAPGAALALLLGLCSLLQYGAELQHLRQQLEQFGAQPLSLEEAGAFSGEEARLLAIQARQEEAVRAAVTAERFKVELISNVSHDLRTPLTSILGYSELLEQEALSPEGSERLRRLKEKAGYMGDLVESIFELSKVASGDAPGKREALDLVRLLEQTLGIYDDALAGAGLTVRRRYEAEAAPVVTDGSRMHQVFANLLGNAVKYALPGTRVYLELLDREAVWQVRMMNTAGYEMDFSPEEILQRFARGDKARSTRGSGLGLAIAQTYTQSVGGQFRVEVEGDQFRAIVTLPKSERNL